MPERKRTQLWAEAARLSQEQLARAGREVLTSRKRRRWTQEQLGERAGMSRATVSLVELGRGGGLTLDAWQRISVALGRPLRIELGRDSREEPADAGHLRIQELLLRLARANGHGRSFELPTRAADPSRSVDVLTRDDRGRRLLIEECWNVIGDVGAAARSTSRKVAEAEALAISVGGDRGAYSVHAVWVVAASRRNRELVARYPELFATRFPGSSRAWVAALTTGAAPPAQPGLVWCDVAGTRLFAWRRRADGGER